MGSIPQLAFKMDTSPQEIHMMVWQLLSSQDCRSLREVSRSLTNVTTEPGFRELLVALSDQGLRSAERLLRSNLSVHVRALSFVFLVSAEWLNEWLDEACERPEDLPRLPSTLRRTTALHHLADLARSQCQSLRIDIETGCHHMSDDCNQCVHKGILEAANQGGIPLSLIYSTLVALVGTFSGLKDENPRGDTTIDTFRVGLDELDADFFDASAHGPFKVRRLIVDTFPDLIPPSFIETFLTYVSEPADVTIDGVSKSEAWKGLHTKGLSMDV